MKIQVRGCLVKSVPDFLFGGLSGPAGIKRKRHQSVRELIGFPVVGLIHLGAVGHFCWLDLLYGVGVAVGLPKLIVSLYL
ncbi:hypothetical protein [Longitalea luteola]|uniref:hypothetical protein n=1 Tax=Longitalea luteola TaxID=2812563 RepID=UPI001A97281A|nr:hypothetical protein [Longitalea luteola]